ncbi:ATP-binding protein [Streptomyces sp. TRM76323]|uniref:histidine kinase n=1 Tax=Streptomyces tamarix TaxID=3078565 RepID=A0ABU3QQJ9_9ACTN|nr:ATP-binding protein [Streptomyces tamarix]MDT9685038.1 ATP-binding protein [Streptomyces tamarix]
MTSTLFLPREGRRRRRHATGSTAPRPRMTVFASTVGTGAVASAAWAVQAAGLLPWQLCVLVVGIGWVGVVVWGWRRAGAAERILCAQQAERRGQVGALEQLLRLLAEGRAAVAEAVGRAEAGEVGPGLPKTVDGSVLPDGFASVADAIVAALGEAVGAVFRVAADERRRTDAEREQAEMARGFASRMYALVERATAAIDEVESAIEDPDLLARVFHVDHLPIRIRRRAEGLAILGGHRLSPLREAPSLSLSTVLRLALQEVERYQRVVIHRPAPDVALPAYAAPGVVHLLAELIDNATSFSPSDTPVVVRAATAAGGAEVTVEDLGVGIKPGSLEAVNRLIADPYAASVHEHVVSGRIGLAVVGRLAAQYNLHVALHPRPESGIQARVLLPDHLLLAPTPPAPLPRALTEPAPASARRPARPVAAAVGATTPAGLPRRTPAPTHSTAGGEHPVTAAGTPCPRSTSSSTSPIPAARADKRRPARSRRQRHRASLPFSPFFVRLFAPAPSEIMIIHVHRRGADAAAALADALGRPVSKDEGLTTEPGGDVVAHWNQLDYYTDEHRVWTTPEWAEHLADPLLEHPFVSGPDDDRRAILHLTVRLHPLDRELSPAEWSEIGHRIARMAGLAPPGDERACRWIAVRDKPDRMDVIANLIRLDGAWASTPHRLAQVLDAEARRIEADLLLRVRHPSVEDKPTGLAPAPAAAPPLVPAATSPLAGILRQLAAEQAGPIATVRKLIEQVGRQAAALPGHQTAAAGRDLFWAARRLHGVQEHLGEIATRLNPPLPPAPERAALPVTAPASSAAVTR